MTRADALVGAIVLGVCGLAGCDRSPPSAQESTTVVGSSSGSEEVLPPGCNLDEGLNLYERRIAPLLADDRPSSCNQCHLSGVDLALYDRDDPCATMACMVEQGVVDLDTPANSLMLAWIERAEPRGGITEAALYEEYAAMRAWIETSAACGDHLCEPIENPCQISEPSTCPLPAGGLDPFPLDDPGDCSPKTLELVWETKVYAWRGRCTPCHVQGFEEFAPDDAPIWIASGPCDGASLTTLRNAETGGYLNPDVPLQSLLLLKPLDPALGGGPHGGDAKFHETTEAAYLDFVYFLERWGDCQTTMPAK